MFFNPLKIFSFLGINDAISKVFIAILAVVLIVIVLPNSRQIYEKLGFKTVASVEKELEKVKADNQKLLEASKANVEAVKMEEVKNEIIDKAVANTFSSIDKVKEDKVQVIVQRDKRINAIVKPKHDDKPTEEPSQNIKEASLHTGQTIQDVLVSEANIDAIWESFNQTKRAI